MHWIAKRPRFKFVNQGEPPRMIRQFHRKHVVAGAASQIMRGSASVVGTVSDETDHELTSVMDSNVMSC